jgi:hypothetical protein
MSIHLSAPLTITRGDIELECEVTGIYIPPRKATLIDPPEGDEIEDMSVQVVAVRWGAIDLSSAETHQAESALREALVDRD